MQPSRSILFVACVAALTVACGGPPMRTGELYAGRVDSTPSIECLPDPDVADEALSARMRIGLELATESLAIADPPPPASRSAPDLQDWSNGPLREWLERKTESITAARRELDLAAEENHRQRIIGGAVVGLMYESVSRVIGNVPSPIDLEDEPEILEIYQQVIRSQTRPFLETARRAYHACAANASEPASMRHWSRFCRGREDNLPDGDAVERSGETTVEILIDD